MSKSLSHIFLPAFGGASLALALALVVANRQYADNKVEMLEAQVDQVREQATQASDTAMAEAARASDLEMKIAEVQEAAKARMASGMNLTQGAAVTEAAYGIGRQALPEEIAAWDVDVVPDGRGLPPGSGDVLTGEEVFVEKCGACHGDFAEGVDNWPVLAGGQDTLADKDPVKTVGSYWPYLSTVWDYVHRSMPFGEAGSLSADQTYAIVAYILYSNDLVDDDFVLDQDNFKTFEMYNTDGFVIDDRPTLEYADWRAEPCMENCKDEVKITMRSVFLVDTPPEGGSDSVVNTATIDNLPSFTAAGPSFIPQAAPKPVKEASAAPVAAPVDESAQLLAAGEKVFKKCKACHEVGSGAKNKSGPQLNGIVGRAMGSVDGFKYSNAIVAAMEDGRVWDEESLAAFFAAPKKYLKGTKMSFSGLKKEADVVALIEYLKVNGN